MPDNIPEVIQQVLQKF
jgi:hypothetical protein